jgi:hypothetical protein
MSGVMIVRSAQGSVVVKRGWGFVTASALMPYRDAKKLAAELNRDDRKNEDADDLE